MSNALGIAAVTATLRNLLEAGVNGDAVLGFIRTTASPPDKARGSGDNDNQLNLFLYQTTLNAGWRNTDLPRRVQPGEVGQPPLPLNLHYLITVYSRDNDDLLGHRILGRAMSVLHDHPLLGAGEIRAALAEAELHDQIERIRLTPQPLSLEELSKLWTIFQTQYRLSAAYEATVVLIESTRPARTAPPVLQRGENDRGPTAQTDLTPPFPALTVVEPPGSQPAARLGDLVALSGFHLDGDVTLRFTHPRLAVPNEITLPGQTNPAGLAFSIPNLPLGWPAGIYGLTALVRKPGQPERATNTVALALASAVVLSTTAGSPGAFALDITCAPQILAEQRVALLFGDREIPVPPRAFATDTLSFSIPDVAAGVYLVRLRVDGVDSLLVDRTTQPPAFLNSQRVEIQ
ncbi:MAG: DUF4255 domain-containing protein [Roseiflexaceae bacterium]